ncbi:MAG: hypothetical protein U1C96_11005 [Gallionella sp.]|nr:hypothetical protein [Gallionella sp.]
MTESENRLTATPDKQVISSYLSISNTSQISAISIVLSYICGFITVTAYLGSFGIKDYETFRTQYIISGATLFLIFGLFYYFIGRHAIALDDDIKKYAELFAEFGARGRRWEVVAAIYCVSELAFFVVIATVIGTSLLFTIPATKIMPLLAIMMLGYVLNDMIITSQAAKAIRGLYFLLVSIFYSLSFIAFYYLADGIITSFLTFLLVGTTLAIIVAGSLNSIKTAKARKIYLTFFPIFLLVTSSGAFGRYFYGHVRSSIGGGEPEQVQIVIDESTTPKVLQEKLNVSESMSSKVNLITQTDTEIYLGYPMSDPDKGYKTLIRMDKKLVKAVISSDVFVIPHTRIE